MESRARTRSRCAYVAFGCYFCCRLTVARLIPLAAEDEKRARHEVGSVSVGPTVCLSLALPLPSIRRSFSGSILALRRSLPPRFTCLSLLLYYFSCRSTVNKQIHVNIERNSWKSSERGTRSKWNRRATRLQCSLLPLSLVYSLFSIVKTDNCRPSFYRADADAAVAAAKRQHNHFTLARFRSSRYLFKCCSNRSSRLRLDRADARRKEDKVSQWNSLN